MCKDKQMKASRVTHSLHETCPNRVDSAVSDSLSYFTWTVNELVLFKVKSLNINVLIYFTRQPISKDE